MPSPSKTSTVPPAVVPARERLLPRALALAGLGVFVAGMLVAAGLGEQVVTALPFAAAGVGAFLVGWGLWRLRPWRLVGVAGRGVGHGARGARAAAGYAVHGASRAGRRTGGAARHTASAVAATARWSGRTARRTGGATRTTSTRLYAWATRPREPWHLPPSVVTRANRSRRDAGALVDRTAPLRCRADERWRRLVAAAVGRVSKLADGRIRAGRRLLERSGRSARRSGAAT
jgi:hypothetical protein